MAQGVVEGAKADRVASREQQRSLGLVRALGVEPAGSDERGRRAGGGEALCRLGGDREPGVRRDPRQQRLAHELVAKAIAPVVDDDHAASQRGVEKLVAVAARSGEQRHRLGRRELARGERQPPHGLGFGRIEIDEAGRDHVARGTGQRRHAGDGARAELDEQERVALRETDDPLPRLRISLDGRDRGDKRCGIFVGERLEIELDAAPRAPQPRRHSDQ